MVGEVAASLIDRPRIEDVIRNLRPEHKIEINPVNREIPRPKHLFELKEIASEGHYGEFFEMMSQLWYGGERGSSERMYRGPGSDYSRECRPDLVGKTFFAEQKALGKSVTLKLRDKQVALYHDLQLLYPEKKGYFHIFRHSSEGLLPKKGTPKKLSNTRDDVFASLAESTIYAVELPLSIITELWRRPEQGLSHRRYEPQIISPEMNEYLSLDELTELRSGSMETPYTGARVSTVDRFFYEPKAAILDLNMHPSLFRISKRLSPEVTIEGHRVQQFPVVQIRDLNHDIWMNVFLNSLKPDKRFPDSDMDITRAVEQIRQRYDLTVARLGRNGYGYLSSNPVAYEAKIKAQPIPADDEVPF